MKTPRKPLKALSALVAAAALFACGDAQDTTAPQIGAAPSFHLIPINDPEVEWLVLCKVGPVGTYTFQANASSPVLRDEATGAYNKTSGTYTIAVGAGSTITVGNDVVGGACLSHTDAAGNHNHVALASGSDDASVTVVETGIPAGQQFEKAVIYQKSAGQSGPTTVTTTTTNSATGKLGGLGTLETLTGANIVFYNEPTPPPPPPSLAITKTADNGTVAAGTDIGFGITVSSSGPGTATSVTLNDPLPTGSGITWSIDTQPASNPCSIVANVLSCSFGDMPAGTSASVHISSPTTTASCAEYSNTASASATNHATVTATATTRVECQPQEFAGCTPGFWKQQKHFQFWTAPYTTSTLIKDVFANANGYVTSKGESVGNSTLLQGLSFGGGSTVGDAAGILMRAAIAGLLNAASPDVNYFQSVSDHINAVNAALATGNRDSMLGTAGSIDFENNRGCTAKD